MPLAISTLIDTPCTSKPSLWIQCTTGDMTNYCHITALEMDAFLTKLGFQRLTLTNVKELVYGRRLDKNGFQISLRVYTSISGNMSRDVGEDAIRTNLWYRSPTGPVKLSGSKRVNRVQGWRQNLEKRIKEWETCQIQKCPKCGEILISKKGKYGTFMGCITYPKCNFTKKEA